MATDDDLGTRDPQTDAIIGACMAVRNELGPGFLESVHQESLASEFTRRAVPFVAEHAIPIEYRGVRLVTNFVADVLCFDEVIVELKAVSGLTRAHHAVIIDDLKATSCERGLLVNFGVERLECQRFVRSAHRRQSAPPADDSAELSAAEASGRGLSDR